MIIGLLIKWQRSASDLGSIPSACTGYIMKQLIVSPVVLVNPSELTVESFVRSRTKQLLKELEQTSSEVEKNIKEIASAVSRKEVKHRR